MTKEEKKEYSKKYNQKYIPLHKEHKKEYDKIYRVKNKEKYRETHKRWVNANSIKVKEFHKSWRANHKDNLKNYALKGKYKITLENRNELLIKQNHKCAICNRDELENGKLFVVDHNHETGKVRGLLCFRCNTGIGQFSDKVSLLLEAIKYLNNSSK